MERENATPGQKMPQLTPPSWSKDVTLNDGTSLHLRPIHPEDDDKMLRLFDRLSLSTVYTRFLGVVRRFSETEIQRFTHLDFDDQMAIVGVLPDVKEPEGEKIIAVGRYVRLENPAHAELALTVEDAHQSNGIGTHLLVALLPFARAAGVRVLEAEVLAENRRMLAVLRHMGLPSTYFVQAGVAHFELPLNGPEAGAEGG